MHRDASKTLLLLWDMWDVYHHVLISLNLENYLFVVWIPCFITPHNHFLSESLLLFRRESHGLHAASFPESLHCLLSLRLRETDLTIVFRCPQFLFIPCFPFKYLSCKFIWKKINNVLFWELDASLLNIIMATSKSTSTFVHLCPSCFLGELCFMQVSLGNGWPWSLRGSCQPKLAFALSASPWLVTSSHGAPFFHSIYVPLLSRTALFWDKEISWKHIIIL